MKSKTDYKVLRSTQDWDELLSNIDSSRAILPVKNSLSHLQELGATSVVVEQEYLDQDFSAEYSAFYSTLFKRHGKVCRRFHFFSDDISAAMRRRDLKRRARDLEKLSLNGRYLGYMVVRPLRHAPVGRTVLAAPASPTSTRSHLLVRAAHEVHLLGARLTIVGVPFVQQDSRVGACAQAAIWVSGRHFHTRHNGPWFSMVEVTEEASNPTDTTLTQSLPAGSGGLNPNNMVRALRAMGRKPLIYSSRVDTAVSPPRPMWQSSLKPEEVINRYVDSGIPVIIGLLPWQQNQADGHAVVAVGQTLRTMPHGATLSKKATRAVFCEFFLVNDDQIGPGMRLPVRPNTPHAQVPYSIQNQAFFVIVPLPNKVYIKGEISEKLAWDLISFYRVHWNLLRTQRFGGAGNSVQMGDEFCAEIDGGRVIARTYLTFGWKYKQRILNNIATAELKRVVLHHDLPRFVWVTEFGSLTTLNSLDPANRRIYAHAVTDATASQFSEAVLLFHAPGVVWRWQHDPRNELAPYVQTFTTINEDSTYYPRVRGSIAFDPNA